MNDKLNEKTFFEQLQDVKELLLEANKHQFKHDPKDDSKCIICNGDWDIPEHQ